MPKIRPRYVQYIHKKFPKYVKDMPKISAIYAWELPRYSLVCLSYIIKYLIPNKGGWTSKQTIMVISGLTQFLWIWYKTQIYNEVPIYTAKF